VQGASNEIKIQFSFHARIAAKKKIVIEGFTGLDGPEDSSKLEITLPGTNKMLEPTAAWNLNDGKLTVTSRRVIMPNETVGVTFTVINPSETQSKVSVTVTPPSMVSGCEVRSRRAPNPKPCSRTIEHADLGIPESSTRNPKPYFRTISTRNPNYHTSGPSNT
jgi:hypothetical protein